MVMGPVTLRLSEILRGYSVGNRGNRDGRTVMPRSASTAHPSEIRGLRLRDEPTADAEGRRSLGMRLLIRATILLRHLTEACQPASELVVFAIP
jgi:hypothetical protein